MVLDVDKERLNPSLTERDASLWLMPIAKNVFESKSWFFKFFYKSKFEKNQKITIDELLIPTLVF
jgi:hypothetical protein